MCIRNKIRRINIRIEDKNKAPYGLMLFQKCDEAARGKGCEKISPGQASSQHMCEKLTQLTIKLADVYQLDENKMLPNVIKNTNKIQNQCLKNYQTFQTMIENGVRILRQ